MHELFDKMVLSCEYTTFAPMANANVKHNPNPNPNPSLNPYSNLTKKQFHYPHSNFLMLEISLHAGAIVAGAMSDHRPVY